jgi:hypothetical protein
MTPPPSPSGSAATATSTSFFGIPQSTPWHDEDPIAALQRIFIPKVYDALERRAEMPDRSIIREASKFVNDQAHKSDGPPLESSVDDLLNFYGILQKRGVLSRIARWCGSNLLFVPAKVDHVQNIRALAKSFIEQNPGGGTGYSFGGLLERYLIFRLMYYRFHLAGIKEHVGGERPGYISDSGHDIQYNCAVRREGAPDVSATVHWLRCKSLVRAGPEPVLQRVLKGLQDFGSFADPDVLYLCHRTDILSATSIVEAGPNPNIGVAHGDFESCLFYLTDSLEYAVYSACQAAEKSASPMECAIVLFPIPRADLQDHELALDNLGSWKQVVEYGCRQKEFQEESLGVAYRAADCISGFISANATQVDQAKEEPRATKYSQWAFKDSTYTKKLFTASLTSGRVHVFRILFEREDEWRSIPARRQGRRGLLGRCRPARRPLRANKTRAADFGSRGGTKSSKSTIPWQAF